MIALELLWRGLLAGFAIAAPVGPVNILCVQRTLTKGWRSGLISGLGAATADTLYGAIAGFSVSYVIGLIIRDEGWIRLIGGIVLMGLGVMYYFKPPAKLDQPPQGSEKGSDYVSTLLLTLTNPTTIMSFLAVLAGLGVTSRNSLKLSSVLVSGIFCGSLFWWIVLTGVTDRFRDRFNDQAARWMNRIAGLAIGGFGLFTLLMSRGKF